jgi:hypothetical protein
LYAVGREEATSKWHRHSSDEPDGIRRRKMPEPGTAAPLPAQLVDVGLGTLVIILGIFIAIVGIIIAGVVYRESREWKKMVLPMFDRGSTETGPESPAEPNGLTPRMAAYGKEIFGRLFTHMDVAGLLGGAAIFILGILVAFVGFRIGS